MPTRCFSRARTWFLFVFSGDFREIVNQIHYPERNYAYDILGIVRVPVWHERLCIVMLTPSSRHLCSFAKDMAVVVSENFALEFEAQNP